MNIIQRLSNRYFQESTPGRFDIVRVDLPADLGGLALGAATVGVFSEVLFDASEVAQISRATAIVSGTLALATEAMRRFGPRNDGEVNL